MKQAMALLKNFVKNELVFLPKHFPLEFLTGENILLLPSLHRFGLCCTEAFRVLRGDEDGYIRFLRTGLGVCLSVRKMDELLAAHPSRPQANPSTELLALAEQVRTMLAAYPADDPTVMMVKQSAAYQKVEHFD